MSPPQSRAVARRGLALALSLLAAATLPGCGARRLHSHKGAVVAGNVTCSSVAGAVANRGKKSPQCACGHYYQQVYCGAARVGGARFDAAAVAASGACGAGARPQCLGSKEALQHLNIGLCIDPDHAGAGPLWHMGQNEPDEKAWEELVWSRMDREGATSVDAWGNYPWSKSWLPLHMMIGLVRDDQKYPKEPPPGWSEHKNRGMDSACFDFDYDDASAPDPSGCRVFTKTFKPLKELRNCIADELDSDSIWTNRDSAHIVDASTGFEGPYQAWCKQSVWTHVKMGNIDGPAAKLCGPYDSIRRAEEMIKFVLFKPMPEEHLDAISHIEKKIPFTVTWPKGQVGLEKGTIASIRQKCFKVSDDEEGTMAEASRLQKMSVCLPIMFDKAESQGFGINDGIMKFQTDGFYGSKEQNFHQAYTPRAPSLCGRLALAGMPGFQSATYSVGTTSTLQNDRRPTWFQCQAPTASNCRQFYFCWESELNRMCGLSKHCCPGTGAEQEMVHQSCKDNPYGKLMNLKGWTSRLGVEGGMCPSRMGTGN